MSFVVYNIMPEIKNAKIENSKLLVYLVDGRLITMPKKYFPFLKGNVENVFIADANTIISNNANDVIHFEEILGNYNNYKYNFKTKK